MKFFHNVRGEDCEITAEGYEYSPEIGIIGFEVVMAESLETGAAVELTDEEHEEILIRANEIAEECRFD